MVNKTMRVVPKQTVYALYNYSRNTHRNNPVLKRLLKAVEGVSQKTCFVKALSPTKWEVNNQNIYQVSFQSGTFHCSCKDWQHRGHKIAFCKHAWMVIITQEVPDDFAATIISNPELMNYIEVKR